MTDFLTIPADLIPADGRFGAGPSKVRAEQVEAVVAAGKKLLGPLKTWWLRFAKASKLSTKLLMATR